MDWLFGFHLYLYILWEHTPSDPAEIFLIYEKAKHVRWKGMLEVVQKLCSVVFPLVLHGLRKKLSLSQVHAQLPRYETQILIFPWLCTLLTCGDRCQSWPGTHPKIQEFFSYENDLSEPPIITTLQSLQIVVFLLELPECMTRSTR